MTKNATNAASNSELKIKGVLEERGVQVLEKNNIESLTQRGYGVKEDTKLILAFYEALYLLDKELLDVQNQVTNKMDFRSLLDRYEIIEENAWFNYLVYRDLRGRGYVVREGFGVGTNFRLYKRGTFGKDTASYLVLGTQEGKPLPIEELSRTLRHCQSQKKELILAVMNRRGEIVYYSVSQLKFK